MEETNNKEENQLDIFDNDIDLITSVFWDLKLGESYHTDTRKHAFPLKKIKELMDSQIDEEFTSLKECGVLLSKMGEMFIQDIVLKAIHHRHNISKDKTNFVIEKEDVAISLAKTDEYDFLVSSIVPEYENYVNNDSKFYITCNVIEKKNHYIITHDKKETLHLNIKENEKHKDYTFFPEEEDILNGMFNFIVSSDYDLEHGKGVFNVNGYFKLGDIIIHHLNGYVDRKPSGSELKFTFNSSTKNEDGIIVFTGKGKAVLGKESSNTLVTVKFLMGDSNCYLVNEYLCNTLYNTSYQPSQDTKEIYS